MNIENIDKMTDNILKEFINYIGLDGDYFISNKTCPMIFSKISYPGDYISPSDKDRLEYIISLLGERISDKWKNVIRNSGIIRISSKYRNNSELNEDFLVTIMHEKLHSYRNLLIYDTQLENNLSSYLSNGSKFEQNNDNYETFFADASQEILKGSIDTSKKTIEKYKDKSLDELDDLEFVDEKLNGQMNKQQIIDEALVELMAALAYKKCQCKEENIQFDIWNVLEEIKDLKLLNDDINFMCELILKHHNFKLFYWMLDPITYQNGDIHYDFFKEYTKNDQDLVYKILEAAVNMDDELLDEEINKSR